MLTRLVTGGVQSAFSLLILAFTPAARPLSSPFYFIFRGAVLCYHPTVDLDALFGDGRMVIPTVDLTINTPEHTLFRVLLTDAIELATGEKPAKGKERREARRWLESRSDDWVLPCDLLCAFLGIDQGAMLKKLRPRFTSRSKRRHRMRNHVTIDGGILLQTEITGL